MTKSIKILLVGLFLVALSVQAYSADIPAIARPNIPVVDQKDRLLFEAVSNLNAIANSSKTIPAASVDGSSVTNIDAANVSGDGSGITNVTAEAVDAADITEGTTASAFDCGAITNVNTEFEFSTASGTFTNSVGDSITVSNGLITAIN